MRVEYLRNNGKDIEHKRTDLEINDFEKWLLNQGVKTEKENDIYFVVDKNGKRTGEAYMVVKEEIS